MEKTILLQQILLVSWVLFSLLALPSCRIDQTGDGEAATPTLAITSAPAINLINESNYQIGGSCTGEGKNSTLQVSVENDELGTVPCINFSWQLTDDFLSIPEMADGETVEIVIVEGENEVRVTIVKDVTPPTVNVVGPGPINGINQSSYSLLGTCSEVGQQVSVVVGNLPRQLVDCIDSRWILADYDVSGLISASTFVTVNTKDAAGNWADPVSVHVDRDIGPPVVAVTSSLLINSENYREYQLQGTCSEPGRNVRVTIGDTDQNVICRSGGTWVLPVAATLEAGNHPLAVSQTDFCGNVGTLVGAPTLVKELQMFTGTVALDILVPINRDHRAAYPVSGTCSDYQGEVTVLVGGASPATAPSCVEGVWSAVVDVRGVSEGSVEVVASIGDSSATSTNGTVLKDTTLPTVGITSPSVINQENQASYSLSGPCSEIGQQVSVVIGALPRQLVDCIDNWWTLANYDVSRLTSASVLVTVNTKDVADNGADPASIHLDRDVELPVVTVTSSLLINNENQYAYQLQGTCSEQGRNVSITIGSTTPQDATCHNDGTWVLPVAATLEAGNHPLAVSQTDAHGNEGALVGAPTLVKELQTFTRTVALDVLVPINRGNRAAYPVSGTCSDYQGEVTVLVGGVSPATAPSCAEGVWNTVVDVREVSEGSVAVVASIDGDSSATSANGTTLKDTALPTVGITSPSVINQENQASYSLSGPCSEDGQSVQVSIGGSKASANCASEAWSIEGHDLVAAGIAGSTVSITVNLQDAAGNDATEGRVNVVRDIVAPVVALNTTKLRINGHMADNNLFALEGICTAGDGVVTVVIGDLPPLMPPCNASGEWYLQNIDTQNLGDGEGIVLSIIQEDAVQNKSELEATMGKDTASPTVAITSSLSITNSNQQNYTIGGPCSEVGEKVSITIDSTPVQDTVCANDNTWPLVIDPELGEGSYAIAVYHEDAYGNTVAIDNPLPLVKDVTIPTVEMASGLTSPLGLNINNYYSYQLEGTCSEPGQRVLITIGRRTPRGAICTVEYSWSFSIARMLREGTYPLTVSHQDVIGNTGFLATPYILVKDITRPEIAITSPLIITPDNQNDYQLEGTCSEQGEKVNIKIGQFPAEDITCTDDNTWIFAATFILTLEEGSYPITMHHEDAPGNTKTLLNYYYLIKDLTPPTVSITSPLIINRNNQGHYKLEGTCSEAGERISVTIGTDFSQHVICASGETWRFPVAVELDEGEYAISVLHEDIAGNTVRPDNSPFLIKDVQIPIVNVTSSLFINNDNHDNYQLAGTCSERGRPVSIALGGGQPQTVSCGSDGNWTFAVPSTLFEGRYVLTISQQDAQGNQADLSLPLVKDLTALAFVFDADLDINAANESSYHVSGSCYEDGVVSVKVATLPLVDNIECIHGTWSSGAIVTYSLEDTTHVITANMQDHAGNSASSIQKTITKATAVQAVAINPSTPINRDNQAAYPVSGTCSNHVGVMTVRVGGEAPAIVPSCTGGNWSTEVDVSGVADGNSVAITASFGSGSDLTTASETVIKDVNPPQVTVIQREVIGEINGTCSEAGYEIAASLMDSAGTSWPATPQPVCTALGTWSMTALNTEDMAEGKFTMNYSHTDAAGNTTNWTVGMNNNNGQIEAQSFYLPYIIFQARHFRTALAGGRPHSYMGEVIALKNSSSEDLNFEISDIKLQGLPEGPYAATVINRMSEEWRGFLVLDADTGAIAATDHPPKIYELFDVPNIAGQKTHRHNFHYLSHLYISYQRANLPMPKKFVLTIDVGEAGESTKTKVVAEVRLPPFGKENCSLLDWDEDRGNGENAWTDAEVINHQRTACTHIDYGFRPREVAFTTTQEDLDNLPDGLEQAKENYQVIFKDEFSQPGSYEKLDHRLWDIIVGSNCSISINEDGFLHLKASTACLNARGRVISPSVKARLEYRYGYIEGRVRNLPTGNPERAGNFWWSSYHKRGNYWALKHLKKIGKGRDFYNFICRGNSASRKRKRWLDALGVEMQYMELFNTGQRSSLAWLVYHSTEPKHALPCHPYLPGGREIFSGLKWYTFFFPGDLASDQSFTIGMEWTPSGHRGFINGVPYSGLPENSNNIHEYGYSYPGETGIYGYETSPLHESGLIDRSVSHGHQSLSFTLGTYPKHAPSSLPEGWEENVEIDYIRVYQPRDKYQGYPKTYK